MNAIEKFIYTRLNLLRRLVQIFTLIFIIMIPVLNFIGFKQIMGTFYSIRIGGLNIIDPALMFQHFLLNKTFIISLIIAGLIPLIFSYFFGKVFCSWMCPFNFIAEFVYKLRKKSYKQNIAFNKNPKPHIYWFIYGMIFLAIAISGLPLVTLISMPGLISAQIADGILIGTIGLELIAIPSILLVEFFSPERVWCKYVCPVGATLTLFKSKNRMTIEYKSNKCAMQCSGKKDESLCNDVCPLQLNPRNKGIYPYCYNCGACVKICQVTGGKAIAFTFHPQEKEKQHIHENKI